MKVFIHLILLTLLCGTPATSQASSNTTTSAPSSNTKTGPITDTTTATGQNSLSSPSSKTTISAPPSNTATGPITDTTTATGQNSLSSPSSKTTISAPPSNTATSPITDTTTATGQNNSSSPSSNTTISAPPTNTSTTESILVPVSCSTAGPATNETTTNAGSPGLKLCQLDSCGGDSSCVNLNNTFFCLCSDGYYYNDTSSNCVKGKQFPGTITVKSSETADLEDVNSVAYQKLHDQINKFFQTTVFNQPDYGQTLITKVSILPSARTEMRADKTVNVTVVNIFAETTRENETTVSARINKEISSNNNFIGYISQNLCEYYGCQENPQSNCNDGKLCKCKEGLERPHPQVSFCFAPKPKCPVDCDAVQNKQCLMGKDGEAPECVCLPGYQEKTDGTCQKCAFGYTGVDCKDNFELVLTVVGCIAGILILGMVIALIVSTRSKNKRENIEEKNLIENDFQNLRLQQTGFSNLGADGSIFPKIRATYSKDSQPQNPYSTVLNLKQRDMPQVDY